MTREEYLAHEEEVIGLLELTRARITPDALRGIEHYLEHGELEIALELLCLEVVSERIDLPHDKQARLRQLAEKLLDPDATHTEGVVEKLNAFLSRD